MEQAGINVTSYADDMMKSPDFTTLPMPELLNTVRLTVQDLGFDRGTPTTDQIYKKATKLGLDLCPAEVGPHLRLQYTDQPVGEWFYVGMKQIAGSDGRPFVFGVERYGDGLWLYGYWAKPDDEWSPEDEFVFSLRK
jgi:hypothetical protein